MDPLEAVVSGLGMAFIFSFFLISSIIWLIMVIAHWKLFTKAEQPGWASIIPIFNFYILLKIIGKPSWWLILLFIPVANVIIAIWSTATAVRARPVLDPSFFSDIGGRGPVKYGARLAFVPFRGPPSG